MHTIFNILLETQEISSPSDILNVNISLKGLKGHQLEKGKQKKIGLLFKQVQVMTYRPTN